MKSVNLRKIMTKLMAATMSFVMLAVLLFVSVAEVKAYDNGANNGVAPIVWFGVDGEYVYVKNNKIAQYLDETQMKNFGLSDHLLDANGDKWLSSGTCFFVGKPGEDVQYAITNHHVVDDYVNYVDSGKGSYFLQMKKYDGGVIGINFKKTELHVLYDDIRDYDIADVSDYGDMNNGVDLALVKVSKPTNKRSALTLYDVPKDEDGKNTLKGKDVIALGYPGIAYNVMTDGSDRWDANALEVTDGKINNFAFDKNRVGRFEMSATINHGNSGGPLVLEDNNCVIGVNTNGWLKDATDKRNYAIDVEHVMDMLDDNRVDYVTTSNSSDSTSASETVGAETNSPSNGKGGLGIVIAIFAIILVVIAVVVVIILVTKKKTNGGSVNTVNRVAPAAPQPAAAPAPQVAQRTPMVRSMAAQHNGASFAIRGVLTVGRDASCCNIVYQQGTPGVSGKHCTIEYRPQTNVFIVTDLNSSYGTFLMNGVKMEPNRHYSFNPGDTFFVGDKANVIRVEVN